MLSTFLEMGTCMYLYTGKQKYRAVIHNLKSGLSEFCLRSGIHRFITTFLTRLEKDDTFKVSSLSIHVINQIHNRL